MNDGLILAVDLGTGGPKVGLVDEVGQVVAHRLATVTTHFGPDGAATQDAREWWELVRAAARALVAASPRPVVAVAVTGQYASTVPVDRSGQPVGDCLTWLDTRGGRHTRGAIGGPALGYSARAVASFVRRSGGAPSLSGADPVGQILHLAHEEPEILERTHWLLEPVDYLTMCFTGVATATHASRLAMWVTDNRHLDRFSYDERLLARLGIDGSRLPPLVPLGSVVGPVRDEVADEIGLRRDAPVVTGVPDLHAAALGAGAVELYQGHIALSTTSWITCPVPTKRTDVLHSIAAVPGLSNDSYLLADNQETGARALEWLRVLLASGGTPAPYEELTAMAATSPAGARGVAFTPWLAGERSPVDDRRVRGGFSGLSLTTQTSDLVRAVLEGVAANSAWLLGYVERFTKRPLSTVRLLGGGAQSDLWCQIYADTLDREVEQVPDPMLAQLRGVALLARSPLEGVALGELARRLPSGRTFAPGPQAEHYRHTRDRHVRRYRLEHRWAKGS